MTSVNTKKGGAVDLNDIHEEEYDDGDEELDDSSFALRDKSSVVDQSLQQH